jgi:hypothetical protein
MITGSLAVASAASGWALFEHTDEKEDGGVLLLGSGVYLLETAFAGLAHLAGEDKEAPRFAPNASAGVSSSGSSRPSESPPTEPAYQGPPTEPEYQGPFQVPTPPERCMLNTQSGQMQLCFAGDPTTYQCLGFREGTCTP